MVRSHSSQFMSRSVNTEIDLDPGRYHVLMKITAFRHDMESTDEIIRRLASTRREKLMQMGLSYDLAHAKGLVGETDEERIREERRKAAERKKLADETKKRLQKEWIRDEKMAAREQRMAARRAGRTPNTTAHERSPEHSPVPGQIVADGPVQSSTEAGISSDASDRRPVHTNGSVPTVQVNGLHARYLRRRTDTSPRPSLDTRLAADGLDSSDVELLEGFEFDSDLDMPPEDAAETRPPRPFPDAELDEPNAEPWNAVCVVGLRVYSKDRHLSLEVVPPKPEDDVEAPLDRDDPAASATAEKAFWTSSIPVL